MIKTLILDFNGTLLDDVKVSLDCLNFIVAKYLNRPPLTLNEYLNIFTFPVQDYYAKVGFNFTNISFKEIGNDWYNHYQSKKNEYCLFDDVFSFLKRAKAKNYRLVLLSASHKEDLVQQCIELGIKDYFTEIWGIQNIYAAGKEDLAKEMMKNKIAKECLFIGDTLHDALVAKVVNSPCILVSRGHQAANVLKRSNLPVKKSLGEIIL